MKSMKKKLITAIISMVVVSAVCVGIIFFADPIPSYQFDDGGTPVVMTINGQPVHANEYASYFLSAKNNYEMQMAQFNVDTSTIWKEKGMLDSLRASTNDMIRQYHAVLQQFKKEKLKLTRKDVNEMRKYKRSIIDRLGGEEAFQKALKQQNMTEQMYDDTIIISAYAKALNNAYFGEHGKLTPSNEAMKKYFNDHYIQAKHVLILTSGADGKPLSNEEKAKKKALAEEIAKKAAAGEDFDALIKQYNQDPGMKGMPNGYIFTKGQMVDEFYNGAKALNINQTSGVIESQFGYHIIKRVPLDESKISDFRDAIIQNASGKDFNTLLKEWSTNVKIKPINDEINKITLENAAEISKKGDKGALIKPAKEEKPAENHQTADKTTPANANH